MGTLWIRSVRLLLRRYPFRRGRARLSSLLLAGSLRGPFPGPSRRIVSAIPDGAIVGCRHGIRLRLHQDAGYIWPFLFGEYEEALVRLYSRLIEPGDTVVDVGASIGFHTVMLARCVGKAGAVHAFEPLPQFARIAEDTIGLNGMHRVARLNAEGLSSRPGAITVYTFSGLPMGHASMTTLDRLDAQPNASRATTLDEYANHVQLRRVDFVKVDVEGYEREVFLGGTRVLAHHQPVIAFEMNMDCLSARDLSPAEVILPLARCGYTLIWSVDDLRPVHVGELTEANGEYIAVTPSRRADVESAIQRSRWKTRLTRVHR